MDFEAQTRRLLGAALAAKQDVATARRVWASYVTGRAECGQVRVSGEEVQAEADLVRMQAAEKLEWSLLGQYIGLTPSALAAIQAWAGQK